MKVEYNCSNNLYSDFQIQSTGENILNSSMPFEYGILLAVEIQVLATREKGTLDWT